MSKELRTCGECTFRNHNYCVKHRINVRPVNYACNKFMTDEEYKAEREAANNKRMAENERRLNFILTALMISSTSTQQLMEWFDSLFQDHMVERDWRFARKKAAKDIVALCEKIRTIYSHNFLKDQVTSFSGGGTEKFDSEKYDLHEADGRNWSLKLLFDIDRCWKSDEAEELIMTAYQSIPDNGCFFPEDYKHFARR